MMQLTAVAERRYNPLSGEWVMITANRQGRVYRPTTEQCPLCPTSIDREGFSEIPFASYEVAVFENRFPALSDDEAVIDGSTTLYPKAPAYGRCEVVVYSDDHDQTFADLSAERIGLVINTWIDRCEVLGRDPEVHYVMPFENKGELVGATLGHPHGQLYAFPDIPPRVRQNIASVHAYFSETRKCLQCDVCAEETDSKDRVVFETSEWIAFVPFAPQFPFEVHVVPTLHASSLSALSVAARRDLSDVLSKITKCYDRLWNISLPYVMALFQRPSDDEYGWDDFCHLRFEFKPFHRDATRTKYLAGVELAAGAFIVDVRPEDAAVQLREALCGRATTGT